jgi:glutathione synthase/RimK-type ligase-like ATP-grasp enzyme
MILIVADNFDAHANVVCDVLKMKGANYFRLDLDVRSLMETTASFTPFIWTLQNKNSLLNSENVDCVWCRRYSVSLTHEEESLHDNGFKLWKNEWNKTLFGFYNSISSLPWLNSIRNGSLADNKYYQYKVARQVGLVFPDFITTNDSRIISKFLKENGECVIKFMSQDMYSISDNKVGGIFVNKIRVDSLYDFGGPEENPVTIQKYIEKDYEVRWTYVGGESFVCRIDSQQSPIASTDWRRYDVPHTPHNIIEPPSTVKYSVDAYMRMLGLDYGALDFIVGKDGQWHFLEVNSSGQWLWIEDLTGLPISEAVASWLINHSK